MRPCRALSESFSGRSAIERNDLQMGYWADIFHRKKSEAPIQIPRHVGIIMDGNGRWAKRRGLPRTAGHGAGAQAFRTVARYAKSLGIEYLTVFAFSTENWKRPKEEVDSIMKLLYDYLRDAREQLADEETTLHFIGDLSPMSPEIRELTAQVERISPKNASFHVNIALNYGGRSELTAAVNRLIAAGAGSVTEDDISGALYTAGIPDPDLIIRPSGEKRISNFLLWQSAYAEYYFTDVLWPDFGPRQLDEAIADYSGRSRRYGGV